MLIFDLDGTLIDSRRDIADACNRALADVGKAPLPEDEIASFVGDGARKLIERALRGDEELAERALERFIARYLERPVVHTTVLPGVLETLDALEGQPRAVATNKRRVVAEAVLEGLGLRSRFKWVWGGGDGPPKPHPSCIETLLRQSGEAHERTFIIGDGTQDIGAGKAAGVTTVAVLGGFQSEERLRAMRPDFVITSMRELPGLLTAARARPRSP